MKRFRMFLAFLVCVTLASVSGGELAACSDMNSGGQSNNTGGTPSSGGGY
jgi:hypothetical protein